MRSNGGEVKRRNNSLAVVLLILFDSSRVNRNADVLKVEDERGRCCISRFLGSHI